MAGELHGEGCGGAPRGEAAEEAERPVRRAGRGRAGGRLPASRARAEPRPRPSRGPPGITRCRRQVSPPSPGPRGLALDEQVCGAVLRGARGLPAASPASARDSQETPSSPQTSYFGLIPTPALGFWLGKPEARGLTLKGENPAGSERGLGWLLPSRLPVPGGVGSGGGWGVGQALSPAGSPLPLTFRPLG